MPTVSSFFGILIRMSYHEHNLPHLHAAYQGNKALLDFNGNVIHGDLRSRTALRLVREWIDLHVADLNENWELPRTRQALKPIAPLT